MQKQKCLKEYDEEEKVDEQVVAEADDELGLTVKRLRREECDDEGEEHDWDVHCGAQ